MVRFIFKAGRTLIAFAEIRLDDELSNLSIH
jgi:hypothetical protein